MEGDSIAAFDTIEAAARVSSLTNSLLCLYLDIVGDGKAARSALRAASAGLMVKRGKGAAAGVPPRTPVNAMLDAATWLLEHGLLGLADKAIALSDAVEQRLTVKATAKGSFIQAPLQTRVAFLTCRARSCLVGGAFAQAETNAVAATVLDPEVEQLSMYKIAVQAVLNRS